MQVGLVDDVEVDEPERAHPGGREIQRGRRAEPARAHEQHAARLQLRLSLGADLGKDQMARIALELFLRERRGVEPG